jgi:sarcosine oxidase subunit beta
MPALPSASRLDHPGGRSADSTSYWLSASDPCSDDKPDKIRSSSTVVIIGGGLMGIATAYGLAELGLDVLVLEADRLASGATGRNVGVFMPGTHPVEDVQLVQSVLCRERIAAGFERRGHLALASTADVFAGFEAEVSRRTPTAPPLEAIDHQACEEVVGMRIDPRFVGGRWMPDGYLVDPLRLVHGLARAARRMGAAIATHTAVTQVVATRPGEFTVWTKRECIRAQHVVYACSSALPSLAPGAPHVHPRRGQVLATERLPRIFTVGMAVDYGSVYWRQTDDGAVLIGGCRSSAPAGEEDTDAPQVTEHVQRALRGFLLSVFPNLPPIRVRLRWAGIQDSTEDGRPIVGRLPDRDGQWVIAGFGGHGLPAGLGAGRALAESISTNQTSPILTAFDPARLMMPQRAGGLTRAL